MSQSAAITSSGLVRFYSKEELRRYLKALIEEYQVQTTRYGDQLGGLLRSLEQEKAVVKPQAKEAKPSKDQKGQQDPKVAAKGWTKMGSLLVNVNDPNGAMAEVLFQLHEEAKLRLAKSSEALKSYEEQSNVMVPDAGLYYLQLRNGSPERVVVDLQKRKRDAFSYSADFQLV